MRKTALTVALLALAASLFAMPVNAQEGTKPIQLSLWTPVQLVDEATSISGLRLNIYGTNADVTGLDIGIVNRNTGMFKGVQWGLVGISGSFTGWQWTLVNITNGNVTGVQGPTAIFNSGATVKGMQWGWVNKAESFEGFQLGLVNVTNTLHGLQIGLLNVVSGREKWKYLPIVSWSF